MQNFTTVSLLKMNLAYHTFYHFKFESISFIGIATAHQINEKLLLVF